MADDGYIDAEVKLAIHIGTVPLRLLLHKSLHPVNSCKTGDNGNAPHTACEGSS